MTTSGLPAQIHAPAAFQGRDLRLDFFRGLALICIFIDHIPGNVVAEYTIQNIGFSDASELFIFISGYAAGMVYMAAARRDGFIFAGVRIWSRVWQLYVAHLFLFVIFIAQVAWTTMRFDNPIYVEEMNIASFLDEPHVAIVEALLLRFKPSYMDILPLYIALLFFFPFVLWLIGQSRILAVCLSLALYLMVRHFHFNLPGYPEGAVWYFNPLAWQLLFVIGASLGSVPRGAFPMPRRRWLMIAAVTYIVFAFVVRQFWELDANDTQFPRWLGMLLYPMDKTNLSFWRFAHVLSLAYVVAYFVHPDNALFRMRLAQPVIRCGQHSLQIFCLGVFLSFAGHSVFVEWDRTLPVQFLVNFVGLGTMFATASLLSWYRRKERAPRRPPAAAPAATPASPQALPPRALGGSSAE